LFSRLIGVDNGQWSETGWTFTIADSKKLSGEHSVEMSNSHMKSRQTFQILNALNTPRCETRKLSFPVFPLPATDLLRLLISPKAAPHSISYNPPIRQETYVPPAEVEEFLGDSKRSYPTDAERHAAEHLHTAQNDKERTDRGNKIRLILRFFGRKYKIQYDQSVIGNCHLLTWRHTSI
jgi:hypothetical protein